MNCKPGDLALVTRGANAGAIVEVLHLAPGKPTRFPDVTGRGMLGRPTSNKPCWVVRATGSPLLWVSAKGTRRYFHERPLLDAILRPLRDNDGEDEMLRIAGKPQPNQVPA
jgi:hypothetical protein